MRQLRVAVRKHDSNLARISDLEALMDSLKEEVLQLKAQSAGSALTGRSEATASAGRDGKNAQTARDTGADALLYERARELIGTRQYQSALKAFNTLLSRYPQGSYAGESWYWIGELNIALQPPNYEKAIRAFQRVVEQHPLDRKTPDAMYKLGTTYHRSGDSKLALQWLNRVAKEYQQSAKPISNLAIAYIRKHDL
jgi:tol-pal system protein YbgF